MEIRKVGVVGLGAMGTGIAQVVAQSGYQAFVNDTSQELIDRAMDSIERSLAKLSEKGKISDEEKSKITARLNGRREIEGLKECDLVIEAVFEDIELKKNIFMTLDKVCGEDLIFASNTSTLSITDMAVSIKRPERFVGLHFFNPAPIMKLVEVIKTMITDPEVLETAENFVQSMGKVPVLAKDKGGFIVNLLLTPFMFDAMRAFDNAVASVEDIDNAMMLGCGHPVGPLKLADFVGLDVLAKGVLFEEFKEKRFFPPTILRRLVALGFHGRKSGRGFYDWSDPRNPVPITYK